jgi:hypothetical protein
LKFHLPEGNPSLARRVGLTMLASAAPVTRFFGRSTNRPVIPGGHSFQLPALMHDPRALSQGDARRWPARHGCPVGIKSPAEAGLGLSWKEGR